MAINARMKIGDLMEEHPDVDEVFETYGIEVTDELMAMTLKELCRTEGLNYWELKSEIVAAVGWDGSTEDDDEEEDLDDDEENWDNNNEDLDLDDEPDFDDEDEDDVDDEDDEDGDGDDDDEEMEEEED